MQQRPNMGFDLRQQQAQTLSMTPQLQQAIKLLQLSNMELQDFLSQQQLENPLLEPDFNQPFEQFTLDGAFTQTAPDFTNPDEETADWRENISARQTLQQYLEPQVQHIAQPPQDKAIALYLLGLLDDDGYFRHDIASLAETLNCPVILLENMLETLQTLEPCGVFARNLAECFALQLREKNRLDPYMEILLQHLDMLAANKRQQVQKLCGVEADDFQEMLEELRVLNPNVGSGFVQRDAETRIPDVLVVANKDGYAVELNKETLPKITVRNSYFKRLSAQIKGKTDKRFLQECHQSATFLEKALEQRALSILKVATAIVEQQQDFLRYGIGQLKPMVLREIAAQTGLHESTVSRVTMNKSMATPRGVIDLKFFFSQGIQGVMGAMSSKMIQHHLKGLIDHENPKKPLSDDALVGLLEAKGISIARRTVAKYREALHIPSSSERKRRVG